MIFIAVRRPIVIKKAVIKRLIRVESARNSSRNLVERIRDTLSRYKTRLALRESGIKVSPKKEKALHLITIKFDRTNWGQKRISLADKKKLTLGAKKVLGEEKGTEFANQYVEQYFEY